MSRLTYAQRQALPSREFAIPKERKYPIPDESHARNALARVSRFGSPRERKAVCRRVAARFPEVHETKCPAHMKRA